MASKALQIFRRWNRIIHRDFGYFFFGMTIIYCISGIALNHKGDWNPNYIIKNENFGLESPVTKAQITEEWVLSLLKNFNEESNYKKYYFQDDNNLKIFINNGSVNVDLASQNGYIEKITKRPLFFELNFLHYNPGKWWLWFSDIFCAALILISITGLFIIARSKNSLTRRGWWLIIAGLIIPILALILL
jgi:uncharacterized protein